MKNSGWMAVLLVSVLPVSRAGALEILQDPDKALVAINASLHGKIMDHTCNHGRDNRIWSRWLYAKRDLYVYVPPGYDRNLHYPLVVWLHGYDEDERSFVEHVAPLVDEAIFTGKLPPLIVAAPDGTIKGEPNVFDTGSCFLNSSAGDFEEYLLQDVWDFVVYHYPIRPEREAHILAGASMGGFSAYNLAFKHREGFGVVIGIFPPLNLRWVNREGKYFAEFDPKDWGWRTQVNQGHKIIGRFLGGLPQVRLHRAFDPLLGGGADALNEVSRENPIEMIDRLQVLPGELCMYVAYGGKDEFNVSAQVESFLYLARWRGLKVKVGYEPDGRHNVATAKKLFPGIVNWLAPLIAPYSPPMLVACKCTPCPPCDTCIPCTAVKPCDPCSPRLGPCATCIAPECKPDSLPDVKPEQPPSKQAKDGQRLPTNIPEPLLPPAPKREVSSSPPGKAPKVETFVTPTEPAPKEESSPPAAEKTESSAPAPKPDISLPPGARYEPSIPSSPSEAGSSRQMQSLTTGGK